MHWLFPVRVMSLAAACSLQLLCQTLLAQQVERPLVAPVSGATQIRVIDRLAARVQPPQKEQPADEAQRCSTPDELHESLKPLSSISLNIRDSQELRPADCYVEAFPQDAAPVMQPGPRHDMRMNFYWQASGLSHYPLYFQDVALERYGMGHHPLVQPVKSGVLFCGQALLWPYQIGLDRPREVIYTLGYDRPGSWAPAVRQRLPWSWKGAALQAGAVVGGLYMFPIH